MNVRLTHEQDLVGDVGKRNVVVDFDRPFRVHQEVHDVGYGGRHPSTTLIVKLVETLGCVSVRIASCGILDL